MQAEESLRKRAEAALRKDAAFGENFELDKYEIAPSNLEYVEDLKDLDEQTQRTLLNAGVVPSGEGRIGSLVMVDNTITHNSVTDENIEKLTLHGFYDILMQDADALKYNKDNLTPDSLKLIVNNVKTICQALNISGKYSIDPKRMLLEYCGLEKSQLMFGQLELELKL